MPSVDVSTLISSLNPVRQASSYTMPVLSPRPTGSYAAGSYRSTFTGADRPYYSTYRSGLSYDRYSSASRLSTASDDRDSLRSSSLRDGSLSRLEARTSSVLDDLRSKYSPANYVPSIARSRTDAVSRPPLERRARKTEATQDHQQQQQRVHNHTTDFASYISSRQLAAGDGDADGDGDSGDGGGSVGSADSAGRDISTSAARVGSGAGSGAGAVSVAAARASASSAAAGACALEERAPVDRAARQLGLNGLKNIGNTCFMNSVLQCLSNTRLLSEYVRGDGHLADINTTTSSMRGALIKAFAHVVQELWAPPGAAADRGVNTAALKSQIQRFAPRFMGYAQQDAQEFLRYLLEGLHEDVNRVGARPPPQPSDLDEGLSDAQKAAEAWARYLRADNSRIVDAFVGQLKSTLRCTHCGHCSVTFDPFWDLSLPIPQRQGPLRLAQCLEHFTREETLDGDEKPTCSRCRERRKCTKSFSVQRFPRILVIHLKRFSPTERFRGKLGLTVDFPLTGLDLGPFAASSSSGAGSCLYNLYAVSNHSGTTYSGHYTAHCKHPYSGQWHEYNDSRVSPASVRSVVSAEAYLLFYELAGHQQPHAHL